MDSRVGASKLHESPSMLLRGRMSHQCFISVTSLQRCVCVLGNRLVEANDETVQCSFFMAKSRTAPLQYVSVPRLELQAASIAVRVHGVILKEIGAGIHPHSSGLTQGSHHGTSKMILADLKPTSLTELQR